MRSRLDVGIGVLAGVLVSGPFVTGQTGPAPAQIQAALRAFAANANIVNLTVTGSCNGCSGTDFLIQSQGGASLPARSILNFTGAGISAADDNVNSRTNVTLAAAGSDTQVQFNDGGSFAGNSNFTFTTPVLDTASGVKIGTTTPIGGFLTVGFGGDIATPDIYIGSPASSFTPEIAQANLSGDQINLAFFGTQNNRFSNLQGVIETTDFGEVSIQALSSTQGNGETIGFNGIAANSGPNTLSAADAYWGHVFIFGSGDITFGSAFRALDGGDAGSGTGTVASFAGFKADDFSSIGTTKYGFYSALNAGTNKYAFFGAGTAPSYFGGPISVGGSGLAVANVGANSCGTTTATIDGNDNAFTITVGATAGTQCRVTFATTAATRRECAANDETTTIAVRSTYVDTTHTDLLGAFTAGDKVSGVCFAR